MSLLPGFCCAQHTAMKVPSDLSLVSVGVSGLKGPGLQGQRAAETSAEASVDSCTSLNHQVCRRKLPRG